MDNCRFCSRSLEDVFLDLGSTPPSNSFLTHDQLSSPETFFPLKAYVCDECLLVQVPEMKKHNEIFNDSYAYFSSCSQAWLQHAKNYTDIVTQRFGINPNKKVVEIASNDGYLLQYFKEKGIPVLGIEPSSNTADVARKKGIDSISEFFGSALAIKLTSQGVKADLLVGNNVLAHVPDINDFVYGMKMVLGEKGIATLEFPHLMNLVEQTQFDTIYHEHFSYFSFATASKILSRHGLRVFDVDELPTHGGSLRVYTTHNENNEQNISMNVFNLLEKERNAGMHRKEFYAGFKEKVERTKYDLLSFLIEERRANKKVIAYGAAAKGNTLLNYCGVKSDLIQAVVDITPYKQGKFLPGSHIPIFGEEYINQYKPDTILILPWNHKTEIVKKLDKIYPNSAKIFIPLPRLTEVSSK